MQFLGLEKQRTVTVIADRYSEVAALSPRTFLPGSTIHNRLTAYAEMRMEIEEAAVERAAAKNAQQLAQVCPTVPV